MEDVADNIVVPPGERSETLSILIAASAFFIAYLITILTLIIYKMAAGVGTFSAPKV